MSSNRINIVTIDLRSNAQSFKHFSVKSVTEKIAYFAKMVDQLAAALNASNPEAVTFFVWREHAVVQHGSKNISKEEYNLFCDVFVDLTCRHPNIVVVAGSVSVQSFKQSLSRAQVDKLLDRYKTPAAVLVEEYENKRFVNDGNKSKKNILQIEKHKKNITNKFDLISQGRASYPVMIVSNRQLTFCNGQIYRRDKVAPFLEGQHDFSGFVYALFRPAKQERSDPFLNLKIGDKEFLLCVEVCREHAIGYAHTLQAQKKVVPDFHFVVSATVDTKLVHNVGKVFCHVDSMSKDLAEVYAALSPYDVFHYAVDALSFNGVLPDVKSKLKPLLP